METIGNYTFLRKKENELGKGSFSTVYMGTYKGITNKYINNGTKVAIKIITTIKLTPKAINILNEEINIMEFIKMNPHTNIVGCYDIIKNDNETFIILEYCDSGNLADIIKKPIKEKYSQFYFCQLVNGFKYLDAHQIMHRDIKPKNILLTNKRRILKIADFGFAKKCNQQSLYDTVCGSPLYMAPEIMNNNMYNNQTDLWSIGMILYEMLYGSHPFSNCKTMHELKDTVSQEIIEIPPRNTKNKDVSNTCISLLKKLLEKKVDNRISWDDFFEHPWIKQYQYGIPINNNSNDNDYIKQLHSTSIGSLSRDSPLSQLSTPPNENYNHAIKMSRIDSLTIVDNYYDSISSPINIPKNNYTITKKSTYSPEDLIFEMDDDTNKKIVVKKIMDRSSILEEDNNYDIVENI